MGYELVHLELAGQGKNAILRIYIDAPGGIQIDDCESVSKHVSALLDVEDPLSGSYVLEVSSRRPRQTAGKSGAFQAVFGRSSPDRNGDPYSSGAGGSPARWLWPMMKW